MPSTLQRARPSRVRWLMKSRSISAGRPKMVEM
jgi:hypothetical protein